MVKYIDKDAFKPYNIQQNTSVKNHNKPSVRFSMSNTSFSLYGFMVFKCKAKYNRFFCSINTFKFFKRRTKHKRMVRSFVRRDP